MSVLIIIPTYNERENIVSLVNEILAIPAELEVMIIDDNSPDKTADAVRRNFQNNSRVHLQQRESKLGLGTAYSAGFRYALEHGYSQVMTMDADFSHSPKHIPEIHEASANYDVVIGSRYVPGGATVNWGILRKVISRTANLLAHNFLSLKPADCTSGFRLYDAGILKQLDFESIRADGYSYLVEILFRASNRQVKIAEVPIVFVERQRGKSKISRKEIFKAIRTMLRLRFSSGVKADGVVVRI